MRFDLIYRKYESEPDYLDSEAWAREFFERSQEQSDLNAHAIFDLARDKWRRLGEAREILEKKATSLIVFSMTVVTLLASLVPHGLWFGLSLSFLSCAVISATMVLFPCDWPDSLSIRDALETCDYEQEKQKAQLSASIHCAIVGGRRILATKSRWIALAYSMAMAGTVLLIMLRVSLP